MTTRPPDDAWPPAVVATLLALAGIRFGEVVVAVGGGRLLAVAASAAAGPDGRMHAVDPGPAPDAPLPFDDGAVDKVLGDARLALAEARRVLRPYGRLAVWAPDPPGDALRAAGFEVLHETQVEAVHYATATRPPSRT